MEPTHDDPAALDRVLDPAHDDPAAEGPAALDPLDAVRARLEGIADVPLEERVGLFEEANAVLSAELAALDEV